MKGLGATFSNWRYEQEPHLTTTLHISMKQHAGSRVGWRSYRNRVESQQLSSVQALSRVPTLCDPIDCSMPGLPVHYQLLELTQTHVHWVGDAIQPSHLLSSPSPPTFNLFQYQGLFQWLGSSHQVAKVMGVSASASVLPMIFRTDLL